MKNFLIKKINNDKKGFALLFSILVSVMVLAVGASIINIALKQIILSGAGRESQFAFYAANTGLECALYWDLNGTVVDDAGVASYVFPPPDTEGLRVNDTENLECSGTNIVSGDTTHGLTQTYTKSWITDQTNSTTFRIAVANEVNNADGILYCAEVTVEKTLVGVDNDISTKISSQGLNTCDPDDDKRAVQRGLVLEYRS